MMAKIKISEFSLGDIVTLDDNPMMVRCVIPANIERVNCYGFIILGELEYICQFKDSYLLLYEKNNVIPNYGTTIAEGVTGYLPSHLPSIGGAIVEIYFRVIEFTEREELMVILYRGEEAISYYNVLRMSYKNLKHTKFKKSKFKDSQIEKFASVVNNNFYHEGREESKIINKIKSLSLANHLQYLEVIFYYF
jgi:hypothetical protein